MKQIKKAATAYTRGNRIIEESSVEPKPLKIREFIDLYNAELQKMFNDEENAIYCYDIFIEWNGYRVNLGNGATPTNALLPALEDMDREYEGEM